MPVKRSPRGLGRVAALGLVLCLAPAAFGAMRTIPRGRAQGSEAVRRAVAAPTPEGRVEALIQVLTGDDLPAALEAMEVLAQMGPRVVPRLVSEMRRTRNNWLIGGTLVRMGSEAVGPLIELLEGADEATTVDCLYLLGEIQDRRAVPTLIRYLEDPREQVRLYAVTSLLQIGGPRAVEAVLGRLVREGKGLSGLIVEALLRYAQNDVEPVIQALTSPNPRIRQEAAYLLGGLGDLRAVEPLVAALEDPEPRVRENAAFSLGKLADRIEEATWVVDALAKRLADPDEVVAEVARAAVARFGRAAVDRLVDVCRTAPPEVKVRALNALRDIGDPGAEDVMIDLLDHPVRAVRVAAVAGLIEVGTARAVEPLLNALRDEDLRWFAGLALERVGAENPDLFFASSPGDPTMSLRFQILERLGTAVVPFLAEKLRDENPGRRAAACWILGEIGDPAAVPDLAAALDDPQVGWLAARALARLGEPGCDALLRVLKGSRNDRAALQAVEGLALCDTPEAWDAVEGAVAAALPREARVRAAVLVSRYGDPVRVARIREYLDTEGRDLWPDVEAALRAEAEVR
ncbi:HEAT repeat domain-containing protein [Deferrisoma sp.]